jgi:hypothetical protein
MKPQAAHRSPDSTGSDKPDAGGVDINSDTGLCTDYLNHFNEAIMVLEMLTAVPEVIEEFIAWQPRSYHDHFAGSNFKNRDAVLSAYQAANPATREALDALADSMNTMLAATRDVIIADKSAKTSDALAAKAVSRLKPLVARAGMVINGRLNDQASTSEASAPQAAVDALLQR